MVLFKGRKKYTHNEAKMQWDNARMQLQNEQEFLLWIQANPYNTNMSLADIMIYKLLEKEGGIEEHLKKIEYLNEKMKYCEQFIIKDNIAN